MNYADSSFLVALYLADDPQQGEQADAFMESEAQPVFFTPFNRVEVRNALRLSRWRGNVRSAQVQTAFAHIDADLREGFLVHTAVNHSAVYRLADELSAKHAGTRTLDLLHVASAVSLKAKTFLTFDTRQTALAKAAGLRIRP